MPQVEVIPARPEDRVALANLIQLYTHDFSEHWAATAQGDLQDDGRFPDYPLAAYWRDPDHIPLLLRLDGPLIGFALVNAASHSGRPLDRNMAEFFIARKYRRSGAGAAAAQEIFTRYPGLWEVAVARHNVGALAFWRRVIAGHPLLQERKEFDVATEAWNGPIIRFRSGPTVRDDDRSKG